MVRFRALFVAAANVVLLVACHQSPASPREPRSRPRATFTVHEWGLFAFDIGAPSGMSAASGSQSSREALSAPGDLGGPAYGLGRELGRIGTGAAGGKPVIYVHLDEGVETARFSLRVGIGRSYVVEHFPGATVEDARLVFGPLVASRGRCAAPSAPPSADAPGCTGVYDGFCEAAEIPRYHGDDDTCLATSGQSSELLFYRARELPAQRLPLVLERTGETYAVRARAGGRVDGPVIFVERLRDGSVRYRSLAANERAGAVPDGGSTSASDTRASLTAHARSLGLTEAEADAFIDAWSPAFFDTCHRIGPEASGTPPGELGLAEVSLLYFAPRAVIDAILPLTTEPPARQVDRAFLVRIVDGSRAPAFDARFGTGGSGGVGSGTYGLGNGIGSLGHGGGDGSSHAFGWSTGDRDLARPTVRVDRPRTTAGLTPDQVRRVLQRNVAQVAHCYEQALTRNARAAGDVGVSFAVTPQGTVSGSSVTTPFAADRAVDACVSRAVLRWAFPAPDPAGTVTATVTYHFAPPPG